MTANALYGHSLWASREVKIPEVFETYTALADSDAEAQGLRDIAKIAFIDDVTPQELLERTEAQQDSITGRYVDMLYQAGFDQALRYSTMDIDPSPRRLLEIMATIEAKDFFGSILPAHKRADETLSLAQILLPARELNMLVHGANDLGVGTFLFGPRTHNFANWFRTCPLLGKEIRIVHAAEKVIVDERKDT